MAPPGSQIAAAVAAAGGLTARDRRILAAVNVGASSLSLVGSAFIVLCYLLFKELRKFSFKLIFFLALSDMLCSFFTIVGDPSNGFFCYAQDYSAHFFCVASFLWTTTIAFTLHRTVVKHKTDVEDLGSVFHLYVWGTSLAMTVIRSIGNDYGRLGAWCWTETAHTGKAVHFVTFYAPLWGAILYNGFSYFQVIRMLKNVTRMAVGISDHSYQFVTRADMKFRSNNHCQPPSAGSTREAEKTERVAGLSELPVSFAAYSAGKKGLNGPRVRPIISATGSRALKRWGYYPLILIGSWAFGTINRVHDFINPGHKIFWLSVLDVGFAALMGLFNSIAYGLNSSVRRAISERLDLCLPERIHRWFPNLINHRSQQEASELVSLKVEVQQ